MHFYIHFPFCRRKCLYCDFYSVTDARVAQIYAEAVKKEIMLYRGMTAKTVYIGGGTPTCVPDALLSVIDFINENLKITSDTEFTVEANPGTVDKELFEKLRSRGVNRLSLGVQSFLDEELKALGRIHSPQDALDAVKAAKGAGFENISVDIMTAIPGQTVESLKKTLSYVKELGVQHVSAYSLIIEEGTPFYDMKLDLPDEDTEREMYYLTRDELKKTGILQYEISNFAIPGFESVHNCAYWQDKEYIGIGAGAYSFYKNERFCNLPDIEKYIAESGRHENVERISETERKLELFMLGLRMTDGVTYNGEYPERVNPLIEKGLLEICGDKLRLTSRGIDLANLVFMEFLDE